MTAKRAKTRRVRMWMLVNASGQAVSRPAAYWATITADWSASRRKALKLKRRRVTITWTEPARKRKERT